MKSSSPLSFVLVVMVIATATLVSCGTSDESSGTSANSESVADPTTAETQVTSTVSASSPTVTESVPKLASDPRIAAEVSPSTDCRISDVTESEQASSAFPRPSDLAGPELVRILAVPVSTANHVFGEADRKLMEESLVATAEYFSAVSYGRGEVSWSVLEPEDWVTLEQTSEELGLVGGGPMTDRETIVAQAHGRIPTTANVGSFDVIGVYLPAVDEMLFGQSGVIPSAPKSDAGVTQRFILLGGGYLRFWQVTAHELGHAWIGLEDLYSFETQSLYVGPWDIMQLALLATSPELTAWNRWLAGWLGDSQVRCVARTGETVHFLAPVEGRSSLPQMVVVPVSESAAVVVETRRITEFDKAGDKVVVYSVDTSFRSGFGPIRLVAELDVAGAAAESGNVRVEVLERSAEGDLVGIVVS